MAVEFHLFHLSLIPREQVTLFNFSGTREEWIRHALKDRFEFRHYGKRLYWVPAEDVDGLIFGHIQRQIPREYHAEPEEGGFERKGMEWQGAIVLIDPTHHNDGQKAAVEEDNSVGQPRAIIDSLLKFVNGRGDRPYEVLSNAIFDANEFWSFSEQHGNRVRYIRFRFAVPNMWQNVDDLYRDLRNAGVITGAQNITTTYQSKDGVKTDTPIIQSAVEYSAQGGGRFSARSLDGVAFSSTSREKIVRIHETMAAEGGLLPQLRRLWRRILGGA